MFNQKNIGELHAVLVLPGDGAALIDLHFERAGFVISIPIGANAATLARAFREVAALLESTIEMSPEGLKAAAESTHCPVLGPDKPHQWHRTSIPKQKRCEVCGMIGEIA